jgi:TDG/mug DNA glycosylase family protein
VLPDYLSKGLKVVFVGTGASDFSASRGHYYANPRNSFWKLLHVAGFTDRQLAPEDDHLVLEFGLGLTDVVKSRHSSDDSRLLDRSVENDATILLRKISSYSPCVVCFTSKNAYEAFYRRGAKSFGQQLEKIGSSIVFVTPSPSGRVPPNALFNFRTRSQWYGELAALANTYC